MPKAQNDLNAKLIWSMLKLDKSDALVSDFKPISESILQNSQLTGAYYFYNETYDRLVIIYPPSATRNSDKFLEFLSDSSFSGAYRLCALREALGKPGS